MHIGIIPKSSIDNKNQIYANKFITYMSINFRMQSFGIDSVAQRHRNKFFKNWDILTNFLEENRQHIFYIFVYYVITIGKLSNIYHSTHIRSIYIKAMKIH